MNRSLLEFAALVAIAVFASACAPGKIASGCRSDHEPDNRDFGGVAAVKTVPHGQSEASSHPHGDSAPDRGSKVRPQPKRPWAQNTGPSDRGALVAAESLMITTDGAAYENIDIRGDIWIDANDVTIRNFRINAAGESYGINVLDGHRGVVLEDGEIYGMSSAGILGLGYVGRRLHIHDSRGDALKAQGTATGPTVIEYSFIEKLGSGDEAHADGNQTRGGSNITFRYNNIFLPSPGTPSYPGAPYKSNSAFMLQLDISNFVIEHNWLNGGNYTIYCQAGGISVRDNIFGRENGGLLEGTAHHRLVSGTCDEWSGNVWEDTGEPIP